MTQTPAPARTKPYLDIVFTLALLVLLATVLAMWFPVVLAILPAVVIVAVACAIFASVVIGFWRGGYTLGSISDYLREQREARKRFSPAWHRQQSRRRLLW